MSCYKMPRVQHVSLDRIQALNMDPVTVELWKDEADLFLSISSLGFLA